MREIRPVAGLLAAVLLLSVVSYARNPVWQTEITLWSDVIQKNAASARGYFNLGCTYSDLRQYLLAVRHYNQALLRNPNHVTAYINRGNAYDELNMPYRAIEDYSAAIKLSPSNGLIHFNLGVLYEKADDTRTARRYFEQACLLGSKQGCQALMTSAP